MCNWRNGVNIFLLILKCFKQWHLDDNLFGRENPIVKRASVVSASSTNACGLSCYPTCAFGAQDLRVQAVCVCVCFVCGCEVFLWDIPSRTQLLHHACSASGESRCRSIAGALCGAH